jgi:hypothetical protein
VNSEKLLDIISLIDDEIIAEANVDKLKRKTFKHKWLSWASIAAVFIVIAATVIFIPTQFKEPEFSQNPDDFDFSNLPLLTIGEDMGSFGFEGYMAYDISELVNDGNPWSEKDNIIALPVFKNIITRNGAGVVVNGLSADEMIEKALETAEILSWTVDKIYTLPTEEQLQRLQDKINSLPEDMRNNSGIDIDRESKPYQAVAKCGDYEINAHSGGHVSIDFGYETGGFPLPDKYNFTTYDNSDQQIKEVMQYLLEQFKPYVNMKSPALVLSGDYNIYAQHMATYQAYESDGDLIDRILGYNFDWVWFAPREGETKKLWLMSRSAYDLSEKIGDYPIITAEEAKELLLHNHYITTVPLDTVRYVGDFIDPDYIVGVKLIYRTGGFEEVFMPYYKFYIELTGFTELEKLNLKNFGIFYVPAVKQEYLSNMPLWDGRFN